MAYESTLMRALSPAAGFIRPWPLTALAVLYAVGGGAFALYGVAGSFDSEAYAVGEIGLGPGTARLLSLAFGAGLAWVGWGFYQLRETAWRVFVCAAWVGLALDAIFLLAAFSRGGPLVRYGLGGLIDCLLLWYVHRQRHLFIN